ncbi:MAG TPA: hypothetical protein EYP14_06725, partial [Planctomycetaceae bacterium]|nr:hypothetical protein [Planctomycetaceae bacterium]
GFNNVPLVRPVPLVDALVVWAVVLGLPAWWRLRRLPVVRRLLFWVSLLSTVVALRLIVDLPVHGLWAARDALFALELWIVFPAIAAGYALGMRRLERRLGWLFALAIAWFLLYPLRFDLQDLGPVVGIQRPVPLFAFTTAGFVALPAFFWFLWRRAGGAGLIGAGAALVVLLFAQSRGSYLAWLLSLLVMLALRPGAGRHVGRFAVVGAVASVAIVLMGPVTGRLGEPLGLGTVIEQMGSLLGREGPGAGSFAHRLEAWPVTVAQVLAEPLGPLVGIGLGVDLFQGFSVSEGVLVRKPHNDFLEIWARTGIVGLLAWLGILATLGFAALRGLRAEGRHAWVVALQVVLGITALSQPAFGFAYITVVYAGLTGLWLGAWLREGGLAPMVRRRGMAGAGARASGSSSWPSAQGVGWLTGHGVGPPYGG